ncbi:MAG: nucleotidyltransferase domain-containing protein [Armatimonadota bacterium]|jgi:predicted nucleotidyltransferase
MPIPSTIRDRVRREIRQELSDWVPRIVAEMRPERVILFGSAARGEAGEASDIDLTVIAETELSFFDRIGRVLRLYRGDREINVLVYTPDEWQQMLAEGRRFIKRIADEGRVLYERDAHGPDGA